MKGDRRDPIYVVQILRRSRTAQLISVGMVVLLFIRENPAQVKALKMRSALLMKTMADGQTELWSQVSARAATAYQRARL